MTGFKIGKRPDILLRVAMSVKKKVVILEHVRAENAGTILDFLKKKEISHCRVRLFSKDLRFPDPRLARALVVMGGPMNVYEEKKYPFLKKENAYIQKCVKAGVPFLGICLGSQLLAKALNARVYKARKAEVGWGNVRLLPSVKNDPLLSGLKIKKLQVIQWHEDTFDLPRGAVRLASSVLVPNQAFVLDGKYYGLQFHVEVNRSMLETWFKNHPGKEKILQEYDRYKRDLQAIVAGIYSRFFNL